MAPSHARRSFVLHVALLGVILLSAVPGSAQRRRSVRHPGPAPTISPDCKPDLLPAPLAEACRESRLSEGKRLFETETFGGNGRTCATCHSPETGTFSTADVQRRLAANPSDP